jgi:type VI protein secretion system component Hcp
VAPPVNSVQVGVLTINSLNASAPVTVYGFSFSIQQSSSSIWSLSPGAPDYSGLTVYKKIDATTPSLYGAATTLQLLGSATLAAGDSTFQFREIMITEISHEAGGIEKITFKYRSISEVVTGTTTTSAALGVLSLPGEAAPLGIKALEWGLTVPTAVDGVLGLRPRVLRCVGPLSTSSPAWLQSVTAPGALIPSVTVDLFDRPGGATTVLTYTLKDVRLSGVRYEATGADSAVDQSLYFRYGSLTISAGSAPPACWSFITNSKC